jgi:acyl-CoA reductase-like NAD-dependent aldehyde dehydrogenase
VEVPKANLFVTKNPSNGIELAKLVQCNETVLESAVKSASYAFESWKKLGFNGRGRIIYK